MKRTAYILLSNPLSIVGLLLVWGLCFSALFLQISLRRILIMQVQ